MTGWDVATTIALYVFGAAVCIALGIIAGALTAHSRRDEEAARLLPPTPRHAMLLAQAGDVSATDYQKLLAAFVAILRDYGVSDETIVVATPALDALGRHLVRDPALDPSRPAEHPPIEPAS